MNRNREQARSHNFYEVKPLTDIAFYSITNKAARNIDLQGISMLPPGLKNRVLLGLLNRNLVNSDNISHLVDGSTARFVIEGSSLPAEAYSKLQVCKNLRHLDLSSPVAYHNNLNETLNRLFLSLHNLTYVNLKNCCSLLNNSIISLAENNPQLQFISLWGCRNISDDAVKVLVDNCKCLSAMELRATKVSDHSIIYISLSDCAKTLKEIGVSSCPQVTGAAISYLGNCCKQIEILSCDLHENADELLPEMKKNKMLKYFLAF